jgi:hypothetical protein
MRLIPLTQLRSHTGATARLPAWFKVEAKTGPGYLDLKHTIDRLNLHTICEEARGATIVRSKPGGRKPSTAKSPGESPKPSTPWRCVTS